MADLVISTLAELKAFRDEVNAGNTFAGKTVELAANIDLMGEEWTPIGNETAKFQGTFDGKGYTVSNLVITGNNDNAGFFGFTTNGAIKNLTIDNASVTGYLNVGVVAGTPYTSTYSNIKLTGVIKVDGCAYVGGMFGKNLYADASDLVIDASDDSYVKANSENYRTYVGGIVGFMGEGAHTVQNVTSNINVEGSTCDVGGIAGIAHYKNIFINVTCTAKEVVLVNAQDEGDHLEVGGIVGVWHNESGTTVQMINCNVEGTELKSALNGVEQDVSENITTGRQYGASSTGSLLVGSQTSADEMTWTVSGPNAQADLAALLGMEPSELTADENGNYTVQASIDASVLYVNSAWAGTADGQFVTTPDGVKLRFGTNAFSSVQSAADAVTTAAQTINMADAVYDTTKFTRSVDLTGTATFDLTKSESFMFFTDGVSAASYEIAAGTVITAPSLSLRAEDASENYVDGLTVSVLCNGTVNLSGESDSDAAREIWVRKNTTLTVAEGGSVNGATQISNRGTINIQGVISGVSMQGNGAMMLAGQKNSDGTFTGGVMNIDGGELSVSGVRTISGGSSLMITDKNATAASEKGIVNLTNGGKITAADSEMYIGLSGELNIGEAASVTVSKIENNGVINVTGSGILSAAVAKGKLNFGTAQEKVNTTYDVTNQGAGEVSVQNGEVTFTGIMADDNIHIQPLNVGRYDTSYASGILNIGSAADKTASVNAQQVYIAENESVNEHTLNVYGDLNAGSIYNKAKGNLNVYGTVSAGYMQVAGKTTVTGADAGLTLDGTGSNGAFKIGTDVAGLRGRMVISDHATVDAGGIAYVGHTQTDGTRVGDLILSDNARLNVAAISIDAGSTVVMDYTSTLAFETITNNGTFTIDTTGYSTGLYKLMDYTGADSYTLADYKALLGEANWNADYDVINNDLYLGNVDMTTIKVDAAWAGSEFSSMVEDGYYYGFNAFSDLKTAALSEGFSTIDVAVGTYATEEVTLTRSATLNAVGTGGVELLSTASSTTQRNYSVMGFGSETETPTYYDAATAQHFVLNGGFVTGHFMTHKYSNVDLLLDGSLGVYGSAYVKAGTQMTVMEGASIQKISGDSMADGQLCVYGELTVNGELSYHSYAMGAVLVVGNDKYGQTAVLTVSGSKAVADFTSQKLDGYQTTALPATVASSGRLVVNNGATFRMNGEIKNLGSVEMSDADADLGKLSNLSETAVMSFSDMRSLAAGAIENLGTFTLTGSSMTLSGQYEYWPHGYTSVGNTEIRDYDYTIDNKGTLNIENSSVVINGSLTNSGTVNVSGTSALSGTVSGNGEFNILGGTEDAPASLSGKITSDDKDTDLTLKEGTILLGADADISLNGYEADSDFSEFIVGGTDNTTTDVTNVTMSDGAKVFAQRVWIGGEYDKEKDTAAHTLNVTGSGTLLDGHSQVGVNIRRDGVLNVSDGGEAKASDLVVRGTITVDNAKLTANSGNVYGDGNNIPSVITVENKGVFTAAGTQVFQIGHGTAADRTGVLNVKNGSTVTVNNLKLEQTGSINMDYTSTLAFGSITNSGTITVDTAGFTSGVYKIFDDLTGSYTETEYRSLLGDANWNDSYKVIDNDLYLTNLEGAELYVDSAWASMSPNEEVTFVDGTKAYYKLNAFDTVANALALPSGETAYENAVKLNVTGAVKSNITVIGANITEVNSAAKTADENAVIAEDALTVNLVQVDNTEAGWEVYYPLAGGSAASVYGGITTNFVSGVFTFETTRDPNIIGGAYAPDSTAKIYGSTTVNIGTEGGSDSDVDIYVDALVGSGAGTVNGNSSVNIYSGTIERTGSIIGGSSWGGVVKGDSSVNIYGGTITDSSDGQSKRGIMGGSYNGVTEGNASVNIYGGTVNGRIYAGGSQAGTTVKGNASVNISDGVVNGSIYGTGGVVEGSISISVTGGTVNGNIYAGGLNAEVGNTSILMTAGTVNGALAGGGSEGDAGDTSIEVGGGTVYAGILGGGAGGKAGNTKVHVYGDTQITGGGSGAVIGGGQYAGSDVLSTDVLVEGNVRITDAWSQDAGGTGLNYGYVYGGGWSGSVEGDTKVVVRGNALVASGVLGGGSYSDSDYYIGSVKGNTYVEIAGNAVIGDTHEGYVYGGGWGQNVEGGAVVVIRENATIKHSVIGGGLDATVKTAEVRIEGGHIQQNVYGGGYAYDTALPVENSDVLGNADVRITGGTVSGNVYGGGYHANVKGDATVTITGGTVSGDIYGVGEGGATVSGKRTLNLGSADAAAYVATLNNVYDFNIAQIANADVTVTGDFSVEEINIAGATLALTSGFAAATTTVGIEIGALNVTAAALSVGVSGVNQPSITISATEELTAGRYLVASGFDSLAGFKVDGINGYTLRIQGEEVYLTKDLAGDDYDANGRPDILMLHDTGLLQVTLVQEDQSVTLKNIADVGEGWTILGSGQSGNGENYADIYLTNGETVGIWQLDETTGVAAWQEIQSFDSATHVLGLGDFNGDGITDLLLQNDNGAVGAYHTSGENAGWNYFQSLGSEWSIAGIGDFNHDGIDGVVLQNDAGYAGIWQLDRNGNLSWSDLDVLKEGQEVVGTGDFNGDGFDDVLLKLGNYYGAWTVSDGKLSGWMGLGTLEDGSVLEQIGDFNGDGIDDLRVRSVNGDLGAVCVLGEDNLQWNYHISVGSEWQTNLVSI